MHINKGILSYMDKMFKKIIKNKKLNKPLEGTVIASTERLTAMSNTDLVCKY